MGGREAAFYPKETTMTDAFTKLLSAAAIVGLHVEKTPGGRYVFTRDGETVGKAANMTAAADFVEAQGRELKAAAPAPTGEQIPADLVDRYQAMKNSPERAALLRECCEKYGRGQATYQQLGISQIYAIRQLNALQLIETSTVIANVVNQGFLSWSKLNSEVATKMRQGLERQEAIALGVAQQSEMKKAAA